MKKRISVLLCFCIMLSMIPQTGYTASDLGLGTISEPFKIPITEDFAVGGDMSKQNHGEYTSNANSGTVYVLAKLDLNHIPAEAVLEGANVEFSLHTANDNTSLYAKTYITNMDWTNTITSAEIKDTIESSDETVFVKNQRHVKGAGDTLSHINVTSKLTADMLDNTKHHSLTLIYEFHASSTQCYYFGKEYIGGFSAGCDSVHEKPYVTIRSGYTGSGTDTNPYLLPAVNSTLISAASVSVSEYFNRYQMTSSRKKTYGLIQVNLKQIRQANPGQDVKLDLNALISTGGKVGGVYANYYITDALWETSITLSQVEALISGSSKTKATAFNLVQYNGVNYRREFPLGTIPASMKDLITVIIDLSEQPAVHFHGHDANNEFRDKWNSRAYFKGFITELSAKSIAQLKYLPYEDLGQPIKSTSLIQGTVSLEDGKPIGCTTASGTPAKFNVVDLTTGNLLRSFKVEGKVFWSHAVDSEGNVFFAGYSNPVLYKYSPTNKQLYNLGSVGESAVCQIAIDEKDNVYLATYPNAKIIQYDKEGNKIDWGRQLRNSYFKSLAYHNGFLYGGGMENGDPEFYKINTNTREKQLIPPPESVVGKITSYYYAKTVRDKIFIYTEKTDATTSYLIFDTATGAFLDEEIITKWGLCPTPEIDGYTYISGPSGSIQYNLDTGEKKIVPTSAWTIRGGGVITLENNPEFPNPVFVNFDWSGFVTLIDYKTGKRMNYPKNMEAVGTEIVGICPADGYVYVSGYMGPTSSKYNPETKTADVSFDMQQCNPIAEIGGKIYYGAYPNAELWVFDPHLPAIQNENPKKLFSLHEDYKQNRPMTIIEADGKIVMGGIANYTLLQGGFAVYEPVTEALEFVNAPQDLSVTDLAYKDGKLYGSTTIYGGLGSTPVKTSAQLFKYDLADKTMEWGKELIIGDYEKPKMFGGLAFGSDGLLWSVSQGLVFGLDPETGVAQKILNVNGYTNSPVSWVPYGVEFDSDGFLYVGAHGRLFVIDIQTMEYKNIAPDLTGVNQLSLADDGKTIYTYKNDKLYRVKRDIPES